MWPIRVHVHMHACTEQNMLCVYKSAHNVMHADTLEIGVLERYTDTHPNDSIIYVLYTHLSWSVLASYVVSCLCSLMLCAHNFVATCSDENNASSSCVRSFRGVAFRSVPFIMSSVYVASHFVCVMREHRTDTRRGKCVCGRAKWNAECIWVAAFGDDDDDDTTSSHMWCGCLCTLCCVCHRCALRETRRYASLCGFYGVVCARVPFALVRRTTTQS